MKSSKLYVFVLCVVMLSVLGFASVLLDGSVQNTKLVDADLHEPLSFGVGTTAFQTTEEIGPALWWTVLAVLLIDIGCVIGYLHDQRQSKWRQTYWRLAAVDHQRLLAVFTGLQATKIITVQRYELQEQPETGGFYLALKSKEAPAHYGPALFS